MNAGLWVKGEAHEVDGHAPPTVPVPLTGVAIDARLVGPSAEVVMRQRFVNAEARPIEAVYLFPLPADAAVSGFSVEIDGRRIEGRVEAREKAFEAYDDALADGHGAYLVDQERPNVFTVSVGNLPPGKDAVIELRWVLSCGLDGLATRLQIPTIVSPRYTPKASRAVEIGQPDEDKLNPERRLAVPYGLTLTVLVEGAVAAVSSPSHPVETRLSDRGATLSFAQREVALDRDVVILVEPREAARPTAVVARDAEGNRYAQVTFIPDLTSDEPAGSEVVFLVDCSGSMSGDSIAEARRALELCVRALDPRDRFDIVRFGSSFECLFGTARAYDDASLAKAIAYIRATDATLGGTEILEPLREILERPLDPQAGAGRQRQVLLLTDGQVSNERDVIDLAAAHADRGRIFSFGIGAGVSEHLVREVARQSRGEVELIYPGERIEPKVLRQFGRVRSPALTDIAVDWGGLEVDQAPRKVPAVFAGEPLTVWAMVKAGTVGEVALTGGAHRWTASIDLETATVGGPVPALWGRAAIRDLESDTRRHGSSQARPEREDLKTQRLVELGRRLGLVSSATSYVAVEVRAAADRVDPSQSTLRRVPIALTAGWHGVGSVRGGFAAAGMAPGAPVQMASPSGAPAPAKSGGLMKRMARKVADVFAPRAEAEESNVDRLAIDEPPEPPEPARRARPAPVSAPAAMIAPAPRVSDRLYVFLMAQRADGSFAVDATLAGVSDLALWQSAVAQHGEAQVATAVVLALLERDFGDRRGEWKAAADKARRFLGPAGLDVTALLR